MARQPGKAESVSDNLMHQMTGRRRFNCVSYQTELKMGAQNYREILKSTRGRVLPENHPLSQMVGRVMQRLIPLAPIEGADWKVHVIKDDGMVNAFVLPGYVWPIRHFDYLRACV